MSGEQEEQGTANRNEIFWDLKGEQYPSFFDTLRRRKREILGFWSIFLLYGAFSLFIAFTFPSPFSTLRERLSFVLFSAMASLLMGLFLFWCFLPVAFLHYLVVKHRTARKAGVRFDWDKMTLSLSSFVRFSGRGTRSSSFGFHCRTVSAPYHRIVGIYLNKRAPEQMNNLLLEPGLTLLVKSAEGLEGFRVLWCLLIPYLFAGELQESLENHLDHEQFLEAKENPYLYWRLSEELRICYPGPLAIRKARRF